MIKVTKEQFFQLDTTDFAALDAALYDLDEMWGGSPPDEEIQCLIAAIARDMGYEII